MIQRIGRSGVELHEVRSNVSIDGEDRKGKPQSAYHDGVRASRSKGSAWSGNKLRSHGFGPSKVQIDESMPKMTSPQKDVLVKIDDGKMVDLPKANPIAASLAKMDLVMWSERDNRWKTMADGRRVADLLRGG